MLTSLPCTPAPCNHPDWSPAGDKLAYTALSDDDGDGIGENYHIYALDTGTGIATRLTTSPDQEEIPRWSPDGTRLAYLHVIGQRIQLFRTGADGSEQLNLTNRSISEGPGSWGPAP